MEKSSCCIVLVIYNARMISHAEHSNNRHCKLQLRNNRVIRRRHRNRTLFPVLLMKIRNGSRERRMFLPCWPCEKFSCHFVGGEK